MSYAGQGSDGSLQRNFGGSYQLLVTVAIGMQDLCSPYVSVNPSINSVGTDPSLFWTTTGENRVNPKSASFIRSRTKRMLSGLMSACHLLLLVRAFEGTQMGIQTRCISRALHSRLALRVYGCVEWLPQSRRAISRRIRFL